MRPHVGETLQLTKAHEATPRQVSVCAVETAHVLVELIGVENRWGGPERKWFSLGCFETEEILWRGPSWE